MRSPFHFLIKPLGGTRYKHTKEIGGVDVIVSSSQEDHTATNRYAVVIETPVVYKGDIKKGDILIVHHNVFRKYYDMKGREKSGPSFFMDDLYIIDRDQYFLYKDSKDDNWIAPDPYCFVEPIIKEESTLVNNDVYKNLLGKIKYINKELTSKGLSVGDTISFQPESEYEFDVDGDKLYRMFTKNICISYDN